MDANELIDEIERSKFPGQKVGEFNGIPVYANSNVPEGEVQFWYGDKQFTLKNVGKCDHIIGTRDEYDLEKASTIPDMKNIYGDHYKKEDMLDVVFKFCPMCGKKL